LSPQLTAALPGLLTFGGLVGISTGAIVHLLSTRATHRPANLRVFLIDCVLGAVAFLSGVAAVLFIPTPAHTQTRKVGEVVIRETTRRFQHPYLVALALAILVPLAVEVLRARRSKPQV
jgi:hypothetical protein